MEDSEKKTIIALFAHPDDELGAIGTLANHAEAGDRVIMAWTTFGELTTAFSDFTTEEIKRERVKHGEEIVKIVGAEEAVFLDLGDSFVENSREHRVKVAKLYHKYRPDGVVTWGFDGNHPDHRNTGQLALDGIKFARINKIIGEDKPHRKNVVFLSYYEPGSPFKVKYIDVTETIDKVKTAAQFYADIYKWKNIDSWITERRRTRGMESNVKYAEKYNSRFDFTKPTKFMY